MSADAATMDEVFEQEWHRWSERGLARVARPAWGRRGAEVVTESGPAVDFSSNDYLGLASDGRIADAAVATLRSEGVGATASRLIAGTHREHVLLEGALAEFFVRPASVTFTSGYCANVGAISALVGPRDAIFADALNHASLIDGCRLSGARVHVYRHADTESLREALKTHRSNCRRALIVSDGLFSMDGDLAPVPSIVEAAREFDAWTYLDDAHAVGVLGSHARGTAEHLAAEAGVDVLAGTLGKAFGVAGAFVCGSATVVRHLVNHARSFVFSTAMLPAQAAAARRSLDIVAAEPGRRTRLREVALRLRGGLAAMGHRVPGTADSHVVPVLVGDTSATVKLGSELRRRGILVGAVRPPTVPDGTSRLRISLSAAHTDAHVDHLLGALADIARS